MIAALDGTELAGWLMRVTQMIDRGLSEPLRRELGDAMRAELPGTKVGFATLAQLALLADCLRVAQLGEPSRVDELVRLAATRYFAVLPAYETFAEGIASPADAARFLGVHARDDGPFGNAEPWRGVALVRQLERHTRNASPLHEHERMLARVLAAVAAPDDARRQVDLGLRELFEPVGASTGDPRLAAFCRADGPEVFASVAHGSQIHLRDPFDVEAIHAEARDAFHHQIERATTPAQHHHKHGRTLLVLGDSGAGKTHLLRALRNQVHGQRRGYVGYLQMTSEVGDYARYVLRNFVDSLEHAYDAPTLSESALMYLSDGLAEGRAAIPASELERLRTAELDAHQLDDVIGRMVDRIVRTDGLEHLETDLVHALLVLQRRDPALQRRVMKFLRCEALGAHDRELLGGLAARDQPEDPMRTIHQLGLLMYELQLAALVLLVDQIEDTIPDGKTATRLQQAFDTLRSIADAVPSAVVVISCLTDVYDTIRARLSRSIVDRLEHDPPPVRLASQRELPEIEQLLARRLEHLYTGFDVPWREDEPHYPFTAQQIAAANHLRARDCLATFRSFHAACIERGALAETPAVTPAPAPIGRELERTWNDALVAAGELPDDDAGILALIEEAVRGAAQELDLEITVRRDDARLTIQRSGATRIAAICNRPPQGGALGNQLAALKLLARPGIVPVALRSSDWKFAPKTQTARNIGEFILAGGRTQVIEEAALRSVLAVRSLANVAGFAAWRRETRPLAQLPILRALLELDQLAPRSAPATPPPAAKPARRASIPIPTFDPAKLRLGSTSTMRREPVMLAVDQLKMHAAFLGSTGSGKTTAALGVVEQLLERGISVLLVDRKGDLARYASRAWWTAAAPDSARRLALRERIDIALYTPGNSQGRPLRLPLVPSLVGASTQDGEELARYATAGLAAMMGYSGSAAHNHKRAILQCAIALHAAEREVTIDVLCDTISRPDPELLQAVGSLQRFFAPLSEDLQSLKIQRGMLLSGEGDTLDVAQLLPAGPRARLSIINTSALAEVAVMQFWISRLLIELSRLARRRPSETLQSAVFFDEADAYIPAIGAPPTRDPMFDLLRRARSGGLGVLLATQNPGDFDYKARDLIGTWLVGRVTQERAIDKMRNLLAGYPDVGPRLASQATGQFFVLAEGKKIELTSDRAMMETSQLPERELAELARACR